MKADKALTVAVALWELCGAVSYIQIQMYYKRNGWSWKLPTAVWWGVANAVCGVVGLVVTQTVYPAGRGGGKL